MSTDPLADIARAAMLAYGVPIPNPRQWIPHTPTDRQSLFLSIENLEAFYGGAAGGGKALALDTPVPTPTGWRTQGELEAGDLVFTEKGELCTVLVSHPVDPSPESYRITFDDGSVIDAAADHRWHTFTQADLAALKRRTVQFRSTRRTKRLSRIGGRKSVKFTSALIARNKTVLRPPTLAPPLGGIRTTREIFNTLRHARGAANHAVRVAGALDLLPAQLPLDPYLLGVWLGDGSTAAGTITTADAEIPLTFAESGFEVKKQKAKYAWSVLGLRSILRKIGVFKDKHVPWSYLRSSRDQRLALLQGLMDTDGTACKSGAVEFTNTNRELADAVAELACSLGHKAHVTEARARLNGKDCGPNYRVKWVAKDPAFRLRRKLSRQRLTGRTTTNYRYIRSVEPIESRPMRCITVDNPTGMYLCGRAMIPTHNSDALLMGALRWVDIPGYSAIIFRRTLQDFKLADSLIPRSHEWLDRTSARWNGSDMVWKFPSTATLQFGYLDTDKDKFRYQSSAFQYIAFDELTHFTEGQYRFLFSRLRRLEGSPVPLQMRSASNPGGQGQVWVRRRFIPDGFQPMHAESLKAWPKEIVLDEDEQEMLRALGLTEWPRFRAFVPARLQDNPYLDKQSYVQSLFQLDRVTREQYLRGDWSIYVAGRQRFLRQAIDRFRPEHGDKGELRMQIDAMGRQIPAFFQTDDQAYLTIYRHPESRKTYAAAADTAEGKDMAEEGAENSDPDWSVCGVRDAFSGAESARLRCREPEHIFAQLVYVLLRHYGSPFFVPEVKGGFGRATLNKLLDLGYEEELIFNKHMISELQGLPTYRGTVGYHDLGWPTDRNNRPLLISLLDEAITNHTIETYDPVAVEEMQHFCYNARGKPEAETGYHDDCVIEDALCEVARIFARKLQPMREAAKRELMLQSARDSGRPSKYGRGATSKTEMEKAKWEARIRNSMRR